MYLKSLLVALVCVLSYSASAREQQNLEELNDHVARLIGDNFSKEVYRNTRKFADRNGDVFVTFFTIEGFNLGNNVYQYMAVYRATRGLNENGHPEGPVKYRLVGLEALLSQAWKGYAEEDSIRFEDSVLYVEFKSNRDPNYSETKQYKVGHWLAEQ